MEFYTRIDLESTHFLNHYFREGLIEKYMGKGEATQFSIKPILLSIAAAFIIFCLCFLVPLAATVSFDLSKFDRETKVTCSQNQKGICLQGDAFLNQGLQLTKNQIQSSLCSSVGRAVYSQPVNSWDSATSRVADFKTKFSFIIHDVDPWSPSGDGPAFFLSSHPSIIPKNSAGGFLGLFPKTPLAVMFMGLRKQEVNLEEALDHVHGFKKLASTIESLLLFDLWMMFMGLRSQPVPSTHCYYSTCLR